MQLKFKITARMKDPEETFVDEPTLSFQGPNGEEVPKMMAIMQILQNITRNGGFVRPSADGNSATFTPLSRVVGNIVVEASELCTAIGDASIKQAAALANAKIAADRAMRGGVGIQQGPGR